jgi:death-on-curing protein
MWADDLPVQPIWVAARLFLADNGFTLRFDPADGVWTMKLVAAGILSEQELAGWFRQRIFRSRVESP